MLKVMLNANLTDEQIAQLVTDIAEYSDFDNDQTVNIAEFVHFQSEDECTLLNVIRKYEKMDGSPQDLERIQRLTRDSHEAHVPAAGKETEDAIANLLLRQSGRQLACNEIYGEEHRLGQENMLRNRRRACGVFEALFSGGD